MAGRKFRAADFRPDDDEVTLSVATLDSKGRQAKVEERTFPVRSDRPLADMFAFLTIRDKFRTYPQPPDDADDEQTEAFVTGFQRLTDEAVAMIAVAIGEKTPLGENERLVVGPQELMAALSFLGGQDLMVEAIQGPDKEQTPEAAAETATEAAKDAGVIGEDDAPLASPKRSSRGSSRSGKSSTGGRNGGSTPAVPSRRSGRTRATSTKT
jgi:hypothetical protein